MVLTPVNQSLHSLHKIIAQASSLSERLQNSLFLIPSQIDTTQIEERLETWCQVAAKGDRDKFLRRLAGEGWTLETIRPYLGEVKSIADLHLPAWAETLQQLMQTADQWATGDRWLSWQLSPDSEPRPFEPFYAPCIELATQKLMQQVNCEQWQRLSEAAQQALQESLLDRLITICTWTLFHEFSQFRSSGSAVRNFFELQFQGRQSQKKYEAFLQQLFQGRFSSLFASYPVLAKLLVTAIEFWVEATAELLHRLAADWTDLTQHFSDRETVLSQVVAIKTSLSDPHNRGRSTCILTFDTGLKVVYKPKDLGTDLAYFKLLQWCNNRGIALPFQCLQVLNRGTYGWIEYVPAKPCEDEAAVQRFYQRSGMLLCLIHVLEGTDCHHENLIACGEQPILIDTETLLTPRMAPTRLKDQPEQEKPLPTASFLVSEQLNESVMRTMLLPQWDIIQTDRSDLDLSGFGGGQAQQIFGMQWRDRNTDAMQLEFTETMLEPQGNAPTLRGTAVAPEAYLKELVQGFEQMYQFLLKHRSHLLGSDSPLEDFANQTLRYVFRATNTYAVMLQQSYNPNLLQSGVDRSIGLDILSRAFLTQPELPNFWAMLAAEWQAMEQCDIPFFTFNASSDAIELPTGVIIPQLWIQSGLTQIQSRIAQLNPQDLQQQVQIIQGSFNARFLAAPQMPLVEKVQSLQATVGPVLSAPELVQQAITIAQQLRQDAITTPDGSVTWLGLTSRLQREGFLLGEVGFDWFNGRCGIALFLAALADTTGDSQWHDFALQTLHPLRQILIEKHESELDRWVKQQGISGTTGVAGIVYGLAQIARLCKDSALWQEVDAFAGLITPEVLTQPPTYSISRGVAGTILGLLSLPENYDALNQAVAAGEYLLENQVAVETGGRTWKTSEGRCLTGFYEGTAGIAYALLKLFAATGDDRFKQAAIDAIVAERNILPAQSQPVTWAQGSAGVGLARLGSLSVLDTSEIRQEIDVALHTTQNAAIWGTDSLCWGNLGRLELFLVASQRLERPDLRDLAEGAIAHLIQQANQSGHFKLLPNSSTALHLPGLFHGLAGIGYQLLRLHNHKLPSILLWESMQ